MSLVKNILDLDFLGILVSILLGCGGIIIGMIMLWQGYFSPIPEIKDYTTKEIIFEECSVDDRKNISLKFQGQLYKLNHTLLANAENPNLSLCNGLETTIWTHKNSKAPFEIRGLQTSNFQIPIEKGLVLDDYSQDIFLGWILVGCGFIVLIVGVISHGSLLTF